MVRQTVKAVRSGTTRTARAKAVVPLAGVVTLVAVLAGRRVGNYDSRADGGRRTRRRGDADAGIDSV